MPLPLDPPLLLPPHFIPPPSCPVSPSSHSHCRLILTSQHHRVKVPCLPSSFCKQQSCLQNGHRQSTEHSVSSHFTTAEFGPAIVNPYAQKPNPAQDWAFILLKWSKYNPSLAHKEFSPKYDFTD